MKTARLDLYLDAAGKWRWRFVAANGRIVADSGQGYVHIESARKGIEALRRELNLDGYVERVIPGRAPRDPSTVKVGDRVRALKMFTKDEYVGREGLVVEVDEDGDPAVDFGGRDPISSRADTWVATEWVILP